MWNKTPFSSKTSPEWTTKQHLPIDVLLTYSSLPSPMEVIPWQIKSQSAREKEIQRPKSAWDYVSICRSLILSRLMNVIILISSDVPSHHNSLPFSNFRDCHSICVWIPHLTELSDPFDVKLREVDESSFFEKVRSLEFWNCGLASIFESMCIH